MVVHSFFSIGVMMLSNALDITMDNTVNDIKCDDAK